MSAERIPTTSAGPAKGRGSVVHICPVCREAFRDMPGQYRVTCSNACRKVALRQKFFKGGVGFGKEWTPAEIEIVRSRYKLDPAKQIATQLGRSIHAVHSKAQGLGLNTERKPAWTEADLEFLRENSDRAWKWLAIKLKRSPGAVKRMAYLQRIAKPRADWTAADVAAIFGVTGDTTSHWLDRGWLEGVKHGRDWHVTPAAVHRFIHAHPTRFNIAKVDQLSFIDICRGQGLTPDEKRGKRG